MVYTCQFCGAWFPKEDMLHAMSANESTIVCKYCDSLNEIARIKTSHIARGYERLEYGDFYDASMQFGEALKKAKDIEDIGAKAPYLDAYLGQALAHYSVQVIYDEEVADRNTAPEINCYICNEMYFEDSPEYQTALAIASKISDPEMRRLEVARIKEFARIVDGIKTVYDKRAASNTKYQAFIACDDNSNDCISVANSVRNDMPSEIKSVFVQNPDNYGSVLEYEGEILYAIHHSTCMLAVLGDDSDSRLMNLYSRFYWSTISDQDRMELRDLGFVWYKNRTIIHLPDHNVSNNVFDFHDPLSYYNFILTANGYRARESTEREEKTVDTTNKTADGDHIPVISKRKCKFGYYPQRKETDPGIIAKFAEHGKPTAADPKGWNEMFRSKSGVPYTWYMDKEIDGKKYRAVYFMKFREVFTIRESDIKPSIQRMENYMPMKFHVFSYDPIEWNILDVSRSSAVLVATTGLDCREYNNAELSSDWEYSTIRTWLNEDFYNTAFSEDAKKHILSFDEDYVSLVDSELDFSKKHYREKLNSYNICGSDYFRSIGGITDKNVSNFWIKNAVSDEDEGIDKAAAVRPHYIDNIVPQCVDNTAVSVLPKILVRISGKDGAND